LGEAAFEFVGEGLEDIGAELGLRVLDAHQRLALPHSGGGQILAQHHAVEGMIDGLEFGVGDFVGLERVGERIGGLGAVFDPIIVACSLASARSLRKVGLAPRSRGWRCDPLRPFD